MSVKIGQFGFGVVGQGFYQVLSQLNGAAPGAIARICVRDRQKLRNIPAQHFTFDPADILHNPGIRHLVELIDQPEPAFDLAAHALLQGKTVISANKAMLARHLPALRAAEQAGSGLLLFEAAAAGSVPIFQNLEQYYRFGDIGAIDGILNGSTNYILSQMTENGLRFDQALAQAQQLGFAESDPSLDIDAHDPAAKLTLLVAAAWNLWLPPVRIPRSGIRQLHRADMAFAAAHNRKIRLLASARRPAPGAVEAWVLPTLVGAGNPFFNLEQEYNGIRIQSEQIGQQLLTGKGAGSLPTGFAVLGDLNRALRLETPVRPRVPDLQAAELLPDRPLDVYVRFPAPDLARRFPLERRLWQRESEAGLQVRGWSSLAAVGQLATELEAAGGFLAAIEGKG